MEKHYKFLISFGDGKPVEDVVAAKNGVAAQELTSRRYPNARNIHLLGSVSASAMEALEPKVKEEPLPVWSAPAAVKPHPLFTDDAAPAPKENVLIDRCISMRKTGLTHKAIAGQLGISPTTVGRWIKQYG